MSFISHPLLKENSIEEREYQSNILQTCLRHNTLVILPTALGKTIIAILASVNLLAEGKKVLMLAPTRPLTLQHCETFRKFVRMGEENFGVMTGNTKPEERKKIFDRCRFIFATPQTVKNDLEEGRYTLHDVCLLIFDEAHRARKRYAYNYVASAYVQQCDSPRILALTASPGRDEETIRKTCKALHIDAVEYRTEMDEDVKRYIPPMRINWREVPLPDVYREIRALLEEMLHEYVTKLQEMNLLPLRKPTRITKKELLELGDKLRTYINQGEGFAYQAIVLQSACVSLMHAIEVLTTQDINVLKGFLEKLQQKNGKSAIKISSHPNIRRVMKMIEENRDVKHPKILMLKKIVWEELRFRPESRIIVFTQFRDTASRLVEVLNEVPGARPVRFVGQASKQGDVGLSQDAQAEIIRKFSSGEFNVLVATSIAEEGLDIPSVELVVFFEPIPSEIRTIQRRGRTARRKFGRVEILIAKGTMDEAYYWAARSREKRMRRIVAKLNEELRTRRGQLKITDFFCAQH